MKKNETSTVKLAESSFSINFMKTINFMKKRVKFKEDDVLHLNTTTIEMKKSGLIITCHQVNCLMNLLRQIL